MSSYDDYKCLISNEVSLKKHAILLVGELRLAKENQSTLQKICEEYDVFVVTERKFSSSIVYLGAPKAVIYVDDLVDFDSHHKFYAEELNIPHALQMHKAYIGYLRLKEVEKKRGVPYKTVYKIRSDWDIDFSFDIDLFKQSDKENRFIYMQTDMFYGGGRKLAEIWANFYLYILPCYFDRLDQYWPFKCPDLSQCDLGAAGLARSPFPKELVGNPANRAELENVLKECWGEIENYKSRDTPFFRLVELDTKFPCESAFLHFILSNGLMFKSLRKPWIPLDPFRLYENLDSICFEIQNGNFANAAKMISEQSAPYKLSIPQSFIIKLKNRKYIEKENYEALLPHLIPLLSAAGYHTNFLRD